MINDGSATLTEFTANIIAESLNHYLSDLKCKAENILICGGGRKNEFLIKKINKLIPNTLKLNSIDKYGLDGDYIESQAFAYIAVRSFKKLPISFPNTTGCKSPCTGGKLIKFK